MIHRVSWKQSPKLILKANLSFSVEGKVGGRVEVWGNFGGKQPPGRISNRNKGRAASRDITFATLSSPGW